MKLFLHANIEECKPPNNPPLQLAIQSVEYVEENRAVGLLFRGMKWVGGFFFHSQGINTGGKERGRLRSFYSVPPTAIYSHASRINIMLHYMPETHKTTIKSVLSAL